MIEFLLILLILIQGARLVIEFTMARVEFKSAEANQQLFESQAAMMKEQQAVLAQARRDKETGKTVYKQNERGETEAVFVSGALDG